MIDGVSIHPLRQIPDDRGRIMHMLKETDAHFEKFGEIYFSTVYPGVIKGWHVHRSMTLNYAVVSGMVKLVLCDMREASLTKGEIQEMCLGEQNYALVRVPPGVVNGFQGLGTKEAIVANCATEPHDSREITRIDPLSPEIPYDWSVKNR